MNGVNVRIKEKRLSQGFTLLEVANAIGVREATVQRYESGAIKNLKYETIFKLAKLFNCSPAYLLGFSDSGLIADTEILEMCEELRTREDKRRFFNLTKGASKEEIETAIDIVEAFLKKKNK